MDLQDECVICKTETFYSYVTCDLPICNRPTCSTVVDPKHRNYSEKQRKKVSECKARYNNYSKLVCSQRTNKQQ